MVVAEDDESCQWEVLSKRVKEGLEKGEIAIIVTALEKTRKSSYYRMENGRLQVQLLAWGRMWIETWRRVTSWIICVIGQTDSVWAVQPQPLHILQAKLVSGDAFVGWLRVIHELSIACGRGMSDIARDTGIVSQTK